jgi:tripartite-type tricarboxylate transporter receptor subunit TctC
VFSSHRNDPDVRKRLSDLAIIPTPESSSDFGEALAAEAEKWAKMVNSAGIKPD